MMQWVYSMQFRKDVLNKTWVIAWYKVSGVYNPIPYDKYEERGGNYSILPWRQFVNLFCNTKIIHITM